MHRRRRSSDDVTSPNTYHEIENDDDDEDENDDHGDDADGAGQNFQPQAGSSHHHHNDHDNNQYRQLQHQHELQRPEQSHQQQNTRAFVHSEAHPEPAAEESLLRHGRRQQQQQQRQSGQQRSGQSEPGDVAGRNAAQSGRAVKHADGQVMLDDKSVAEVGDSEWDRDRDSVCVFLDVSGWFISDGTGLWTPSGKLGEDEKIYIFLNVDGRVELGKGQFLLFFILYQK